MELHSRPKVQIEPLQLQQRPDADVDYTDSSNCAMVHGCGLDPRSHRVFEHGSQQRRRHAYDEDWGDCS
jgi:hypothetical protein